MSGKEDEHHCFWVLVSVRGWNDAALRIIIGSLSSSCCIRIGNYYLFISD